METDNKPQQTKEGPVTNPPRKIDFRKIALVFFTGIAALCLCLYAQSVFWPRSRKIPLVLPYEEKLPPESIDWQNPPLPPQTVIAFGRSKVKLKRETGNVQYFCSSRLSAANVIDFYRSELARDGWKPYNDMASRLDPSGTNVAVFRRGKKVLLLSFLPRKKEGGSNYRISVTASGTAKSEISNRKK